jgi:hypothetical protein
MAGLVRKGLIVVTRFSTGRDVFIPSIGQGTAPYSGKRSIHWRDPGGMVAPPTTPQQITQKGKMPGDPLSAREAEIRRQRSVSRDPCRRCGTRGDIGCAHNPASAAVAFA